MSVDGQGTKWRRNIAKNFTRLKDWALGSDWDTTSQPAVRWLFWTIVATEGKH